ncbi:acrosomal protein KIAA1210 isoform X1 [Callorhinchus milii]|uniref:acrosomal protein KIAA1210 isoform X1 n=2 Tax=Callorhinchus milii TaxID=7868 RepID=UPI001C3FCBAA|nr:acrosomal protein KIAA1210 isoform X1 [Callorhinchus milii]
MAGFYSCLRGTSGDYIMATGLPDARQTSEAEELSEESPGKKKSKFKTFKNFFAKKKRKEPAAPTSETSLKPSQSSSDVSTPGPPPALPDSEKETGSQSSMGNRAVSHDSIFIPELSVSETVPVGTASQENLPGRVKALQLQLQQNIRLASPDMVISTKKTDDAGTSSEDDGLPRSPPEMSSLHTVLTYSTAKSPDPVERHSSLSLGGTESEDEEQISSGSSSRPLSPLSPLLLTTPTSASCDSLPVDFSFPANPLACLDNSAAKHKIAVNPRKQKTFAKQMKPISKENCASPRISKFIFHGKKDENEKRVTPAEANPPEPNKKPDGLLAQQENTSNNNVQNNEEICPKLPPVIEEQSTEKHCQSTEMVDSPRHSSVLEDTPDFNSTDPQNGRVLPNPIGAANIADAERATETEEVPDPHKTSDLQGLLPKMLPMYNESVNSTWEDNEEDIPFPSLGMSTVCDTSVGLCEIQNKCKVVVKPNESVTVGSTEETLFFSGAGKPASLNCISDALHVENSLLPCRRSSVPEMDNKINDEENVPTTLLPQNCSTPKEVRGPAAERFYSTKENKMHQENVLSEQSITPEADGENLLSNSSIFMSPLCNEPTNNIIFTAEVPLEDSAIESDSSVTQLPSKQEQTELLPSMVQTGETLQEDWTSVNKGSVKFSIASAWQRSQSVTPQMREGLITDYCPQSVSMSKHCDNKPDDNVSKKSPSPGTENSMKHQGDLNRSWKIKAGGTKTISTDKPCSTDVLKEQINTELDCSGNPFGVRLRRTSPLFKYPAESNLQKNVYEKEPVGTTLCIAPRPNSPERDNPVMNKQTAESLLNKTVKGDDGDASGSLSVKNRHLPSIKCDSIETSSQFETQEKHVVQEKNEKKSIEMKVGISKTSERMAESGKPTTLDTVSTEASTSEPVWISMAKQKQKGFQEQHLGTEQRSQSTEHTTLVQIDSRMEVKHLNTTGENNSTSSFLNKDVNINVKEEEQAKMTRLAPSGALLQPKLQDGTLEKKGKSPSNIRIAPLGSAEPPWLAIAKKKAKAWSDMPQTVQ